MTQQAAALQAYNNELVKCMNNLYRCVVKLFIFDKLLFIISSFFMHTYSGWSVTVHYVIDRPEDAC